MTDSTVERVLQDVIAERARQDALFGRQDHPDGTADSPAARQRAAQATGRCDAALARGEVTWALILEEEVAEALAEVDPARLRAELLQVAAVATQWMEALNRRSPSGPE